MTPLISNNESVSIDEEALSSHVSSCRSNFEGIIKGLAYVRNNHKHSPILKVPLIEKIIRLSFHFQGLSLSF